MCAAGIKVARHWVSPEERMHFSDSIKSPAQKTARTTNSLARAA